MQRDTIFALSSGLPPAALAVIRISGPKAQDSLKELGVRLRTPRHAELVRVREGSQLLDHALAMRFEAPNSATGEDVGELHLHGGRAVIAGVLAALGRMDGLRPAEAGEFTRRAFENGRIDLTEAEGLADLLAAETETQRRAALQLAGGLLSRQIQGWTERLLYLAASVEAQLDFSDEADVDGGLGPDWINDLRTLVQELRAALDSPPAERIRDGIRVVIAGPPNSGKSTLFNALIGRDAAITSPIAGTTRDLIEAPVSLDGLAFVLIDSAGLRESEEEIEAIGIDRTLQAVEAADLVLWLGDFDDKPPGENIVAVHSKCDIRPSNDARAIAVSTATGEGLTTLLDALVSAGRALTPRCDEAAYNTRHREAISRALTALTNVSSSQDLLVIAEELRTATSALGGLIGRGHVEDVLDGVFGRFCIGK